MKAFLIIAGVTLSSFISAQFNSFNKQSTINSVDVFVAEYRLETLSTFNDSLLLSNIIKHKSLIENMLSENIEPRSVTPLISLPLKNISINSSFGYRFHPIDKEYKFHYGVDLFARDDYVYSMVSGIIEESGYSSALGFYVVIKNNSYNFIYGHLSEYYVIIGDNVTAGHLIGKTGNTGKSTGEHLHFAIKKDNQYINPIPFLKKSNNI